MALNVLLLLLTLLHLGQLRELLVKVLVLHHLHELLELLLSAGALARTVDHTESTALRFISVLGQRNIYLTFADIYPVCTWHSRFPKCWHT